ncbi:MAG: DDE-type integrase/transposase/recombinase [Clostridiales bacterium]|nr:DDE-type integrase/transposase/recombinase [Clostridiales bacterium]
MDIVENSRLSNKWALNKLKLNPDRYYRWKRKLKAQGLEGLKNHKSSPVSCPHSLLDEERQAIIDYALEHPDVRHRKLTYNMQDENIVYVSPSTVYRVLKSEELIPEKDYHEQQKADGKIEVSGPDQMYHIDITYIPVNTQHSYLISILDGYSRKIIHSELSLTMTAEDMKRVLNKAMFKAGLFEKPKDKRPVLVSDNGTQLVANSFKEFLKEWNIKHIRTAVRHPESNGKIEVFHKTIKYENVYIKEQYESYYEAKEDIKNFIEYYNSSRLHQGIGFVTPDQKYNGKEEKIKNQRKQKHQNAIERRKRLNRRQKSNAA